MPSDYQTVDYQVLVKFLIEPLIEPLINQPCAGSDQPNHQIDDQVNEQITSQPSPLKIDCEHSSQRTWIRVAFDPKHKGKVLGKGGRTIQSIRQLVNTAAKLTNHRVSLELYDPTEPPSSAPDNSPARPPKPLKLKV